MLSASAFEEPAREAEKLEHDVYTYFFLEAFERGDRDGNGAVTVSEAHDYARRRTYAYTDGAQRPTAWSSVMGRDPIILSGQPDGTARPVVYSYRRSSEGLKMSVDGQTKGALPGGVALEPGRHSVELTDDRTGETVWRGTVRLSAGERLEVAELIPPESDLEIRAAGGALLPLAATTRDRYLPLSWATGGRVALLREPWRHILFEARGRAIGARGRAPSLGTDLSYRLRGGHIEIGAGGIWQLGSGFDLAAGGDLGVLWATRGFETSTYRATETMRGTTVAGFGELTWRVVDPVRVTLRADAGLLRAPFGDRVGFHPYASLALAAGVGF